MFVSNTKTIVFMLNTNTIITRHTWRDKILTTSNKPREYASLVWTQYHHVSYKSMALGTVIKQISTVNYNQPMQNQMLMLWPIYQFYVRNFTWQKFKSPIKLLSLILKSQSHVIQAWDENLALIPLLEYPALYLIQNTQRKQQTWIYFIHDW